MAHPVLEFTEEEIKEQKLKQKPARTIERVTTIFKTKLPAFLDSLILLTIVFWYFFLTGLAIIFRAPIPKEWLKIATSLSKGKVAKRIQELNEVKEAPKAATHRVVDLETHEPITIPNPPVSQSN